MHRKTSTFKTILGFVGILCAAFAIGLALTFAGNAFGLWQLEFFGTKKADIERNIFEGDVIPVYSEPELMVSPFRLKSKGSYSR